MEREDNSYILGTEREELHRLGLQHQVWAGESRQAWKTAEFSEGQTILDLGCGPGFCTMELAYIVGQHGKVIGVDKSKVFTDFLHQQSLHHGLNIDIQNVDFDNMDIVESSLDGVYSRWALAWINNPEQIVHNLSKAMKSGAVFVAHEYYDWATLQTEPSLPGLNKGIAAALRSFLEQESNINIGKKLPQIFYENDLEVISVRPLSKLAAPHDLAWQWPKSFFHVYFPKLIDKGLISKAEVEAALNDVEELEYKNGSTILCPHMIEVIAVKP